MIILEDLPLEERKKYLISLQKEKEKKQLDTFGEQTRYRCEQINVTKVDDIPRSNSVIKTQFSLSLSLERMIAKIKLEDYIYEIIPNLLNVIFDFIKQTEYIKHNVHLQLAKNGKIEEITNKAEINKNWKDFLNSGKFETEFIQKLRDKNPEVLNQIIETGNKQFAINAASEEDYRRELFYMIIFDEFLTNKEIGIIKKEDFMFRSVLIPDTIIPMLLESELMKNDKDNIYKYKKKGTALISDEKRKEIKEKYDKYQKPDIQYNFTEYYLGFSIETDIDNMNKLPLNSRMEIFEGVKHNVDSICNFKLRRLD